MPTIQDEKPAKPRARSRKADGRGPKSGQKRAEVRVEVDPVRATVAEPEPVSAMAAETEVAAVEVMPALPVEQAVEQVLEQVFEPALSGEVLPPEVAAPSLRVDGFQALAQAYGEYTKKSWINGRFLMERLIAARSFGEAIEVQGEFAKQAYANFLAQSEKICVLYGEWAQQLFRPLEKLATEWPRIGR